MAFHRNMSPPDEWQPLNTVDTIDNLWDEDDTPFPGHHDLNRDRGGQGHCGNCSSCKCRCTCLGKSRTCGVVTSVLILVAMSALGAGLGYYSLVVHQPPPVIDKSITAFSIPKHEGYMHWDSLQLARKNNMSKIHYRRRRESVPSFPPHPLQQDSSLGSENNMKGFSANSSSVLWPDTFIHGSLADKQFNYRNHVALSRRFESPKSGLGSDYTNDAGQQEQSMDGRNSLQKHSLKKRNIGISCGNICQRSRRWRMHVIFEAIGEDSPNIFTPERLQTIHEAELAIVRHERFPEFCFKDISLLHDPAVMALNGCAPLNSLMTYFYPSENEKGEVFYDGLGDNLGNIDSALKYAMSRNTFYYYVDDKINGSYKHSKFLRTEVQFGAPLEGFANYNDRKEQQEDLFKDFIYTYPKILSNFSTSKVRVLYGSNELFDHEVSDTFWADLLLALWAVFFIVAIMFVLTSFSTWLTFCGMLSIALSFPLALFFYRVAAGINALGILNGAAAFVIIGIGVDDVFVFVNVFRQSTKHDSLRSRLMYTIRTAGRATFFTSFTTAAAFAANIASSIPAVYEFGLFMALIVSCCWLTVVLIMPPALYLWSLAFHRCEVACLPCCTSNKTGQHATAGEFEATQTTLDDDADVPMLQMELEENLAAMESFDENDDDVGILVPDPYQVSTATRRPAAGSGSGCLDIGGWLQRGLTLFTSVVVVRSRWLIIGFYMVLVGMAIGLMSQLTPADRPPQLFRPDTNLQRLLDLKANFSVIDSLRCNTCSAVYDNTPLSQPAGIPRTPSRTPSNPSSPSTTTATTPTTTTATTPTTTTAPTTTAPTTTSRQPPVTRRSTTASSAATPTIGSQTVRPATTRPHGDRTSIPWQDNSKPTSPTTTKATEVAGSVKKDFDACSDRQCSKPTSRPPIQTGSAVFVVFGIQSLQRNNTNQGHVIDEEEGTVIFDENFHKGFQSKDKLEQMIRDLCKVCQVIANASELVQDRHADCIPYRNFLPPYLQLTLRALPECQDLPSMPHTLMEKSPPQAMGSFVNGSLLWLAFVFESKTNEGQSYSEAYGDYQKWENMIKHIRSDVLAPNSPLQSIFQTSEFWKKVLMEEVAVNSAIYSVVLSLVICIVAVSIFTGHPALLFIVFITIFSVVCSVLGLFYLLGWRMGAVEAISLSILVGSSVDYCVHLVEGFLLAQPPLPLPLQQPQSNAEIRQDRTKKAVHHIGVSILSSAITTIIAAIPLTQTTIQPFAKFGKIVLINTSFSILFTLTLSAALLVLMGPARFRLTWKASAIATAVTAAAVGVVVLILFAVSKTVYSIPGPGGDPLFP